MKKIISVLSIIISILFLISCGQDIESEVSRLDELKLEYDQIGIQHNLELNKMLSVYRDHSGVLTKQAMMDMADGHFATTGNFAKYIVDMISDKQQFAKLAVSADVIDYLADSVALFANYPEVYDSIAAVLDCALDVHDKIVKLEGFYLYVDATVDNEDDKRSILNGLSTTIHSLEYWDENYNEWQQTSTGTLGKRALGIIGIIGITDGVGAVIGTLEGIRDTYKGQEGRLGIIAGRAVGEAAKTSVYAFIAIML